jgi:hypothetical protein
LDDRGANRPVFGLASGKVSSLLISTACWDTIGIPQELCAKYLEAAWSALCEQAALPKERGRRGVVTPFLPGVSKDERSATLFNSRRKLV